MSFHSSLVPEADCLERTCSDGDLSDTLNGTTTASASSLRASETDICPSPQSSLTCVSSHSPAQPTSTEELRTWLQRAFPVSRFHSVENNSEKPTNETCGPRRQMSFAVFDRDSSVWKMSQRSLPLDLSEQSSPIWPRSGMTRHGIAYQRRSSAIHASATGLGLLPTPTVSQGRNKTSGRKPDSQHHDGMTLLDWIWLNVGREKRRPCFEEWMMGFPIGWTALEVLETPRFREWLQAHSPFSQTNKDAA